MGNGKELLIEGMVNRVGGFSQRAIPAFRVWSPGIV